MLRYNFQRESRGGRGTVIRRYNIRWYHLFPIFRLHFIRERHTHTRTTSTVILLKYYSSRANKKRQSGWRSSTRFDRIIILFFSLLFFSLSLFLSLAGFLYSLALLLEADGKSVTRMTTGIILFEKEWNGGGGRLDGDKFSVASSLPSSSLFSSSRTL